MAEDDFAAVPAVEQAGGIVFRAHAGDAEILLVRAKKNPQHWIFPKGHVEHGETAAEAAVREVLEEAGVQAQVVRAVDPPLEFDFAGERIRVRYYLMVATGESARGEDGREPRWCTLAVALDSVTHDDARRLLRESVPDILKEVHS